MQLIRSLNGLPSTLKLKLVQTTEQAEELMRWLSRGRPVLGVDTETSGLDYWREELRMVQLGDMHTGWAIPYPEWGGLAKEAISVYDREVVMHNAKFDIHFLERFGFDLDRTKIHDTRVLAHLLNNDDRTGLKYLGVKYVDPNAEYLETQLKTAMTSMKVGWGDVPYDHPAYWQYAALDPVITAAMYELTAEDVATDYMEAYDLEMATQQVLVDMENRGVRVDTGHTQELMLRFWEHCDYLAEQGESRYQVNLGSNDQVTERLVTEGVNLTKRTKSGKFAADEEVLKSVDHPLADMVLEHRHLTKIANTYLKNFIDLSDSRGYLHPSLNLLGARTGRMSVSRPSLQNLERTSDVRNSFIPSEDRTLLLIDYDQIEMRLFAHYSRSSQLLAAFAPESEVDGFTRMTREIHRDPLIQKDDPRRHTTKNAAYSKIYGAGLAKFAATAGITEIAATLVMDRFNESYPEVNQFIREVEKLAHERQLTDGVPYVTTGYGNRRLLIQDTNKLYKLVNYLIQGTAAQVLKDRIVALDLAGLADYLVLPVHDELVFDVPTNEAEDYAHDVQAVMNVSDRFAVPLTTEAKFVDRWGDAYPPGRFTENLGETV